MMARYLIYLVLVLAIITTACRQAEPETAPATSELETTPAKTTPSATSPATPTQSSIRLAPTFTIIPTVTHSATPTHTPSPPVVLLSREDFGDDRNLLTGELVGDPAILARRPIAVKISNSPAKYVRPQSGLSQSDLVFEHITEGPITRFTAILYGQTPPNMGPIRSGRLIDLELPAMYDAALAYSGSSIGVSRKLFSSDFRPRILRSSEPGYYRTGEDKPYEHTLYAHPAEFWDALDDKGENRPPRFGTTMAFSSLPPEGGQAASEITVRYQDWTTIEWRYNPDTGHYDRWADGEPDLDANTGEQINVANVVLVYATHLLDRSICEFQSEDQCLAFSTEIILSGQGDATLLRDGRQYEVKWVRENRGDMLTLVDEGGQSVPMQIGHTWFQIIPTYYNDPVTTKP
jgi:hypothetical protein